MHPLLPLLLLLPLAASTADFCDSEPRLSLTHRHCPSNPTPRLLLHLPLLDQNPFHAVHDILWAVSHYLHHCALLHHPTLHIPGPAVTVSDCRPDRRVPPSRAYWGVCAALALATHTDAALIWGQPRPDPAACFDKELAFVEPTTGFGDLRPDFRAITWFGRGCIPDRHGQCLPNVDRAALVALPDRYKAAALAVLREAIMKFVGVSLRRDEGRPGSVRVLLYDRNDTARRQWANAGQVYARLRKDERVDVRFVHATPPTLRQQVELYAWADVLVAPHGAAMVNTLFLRPGAEVVEMWKRCDNNVARDRFQPHDWTGWHASLLDVNLQYVQCHRANGPFKEPRQLLDGKLGPPTDGPHKMRIAEIFKLLESAITRQQVRLRVLREEAEAQKKVGTDVKRMLNSFTEDGALRLASKVSLYVLAPACTTLLAIWNLSSSRRKVSAKR